MSTRARRHNPFTRRAPRYQPPERDRQADRTLPTNSTAWRRLREEVLLRDLYTCQVAECGRVLGGKGEAHVDHVDGDPSNNAMANLQTLCRRCHSEKTAREDGGFGNRSRGNGARAAAGR